MTLLDRQPTGRYKSITKTFTLSDARTVLVAARGAASVSEAFELSIPRLTQGTHRRRRDVVRSVLRHLLGCEDGLLPWNALVDLLADSGVPPYAASPLFGLLYCAHTPLARLLVAQLYLAPMDEAAAGPTPIAPNELRAWLADHLEECSPNVLANTCSTMLMMLRKFGYIGDAQALSMSERCVSPALFAGAVVLDYRSQGWSTRSLDYVTSSQGPRALLMLPKAEAVLCFEQAVGRGLLTRITVAGETDVGLPRGDTLTRVAEEVRCDLV